jgi:hypothetical protein
MPAGGGAPVYLIEPVIWLEGAAVTLKGACTRTQRYSFCPAAACGQFETGGGFGHLGGFQLQISGER